MVGTGTPIGRRSRKGHDAPTRAGTPGPARARRVRLRQTSGTAAAGDRPPARPRRRGLPAVLRRRRTAQTRVRFVEPGQVATPPERAGDPAASFGILTDPDDVETPLWLLHRRRAGRRGRDPASQGQRRRQREARAAAVLPGAQEPAPGREAAAQHERRGRNPVGHRPDPQTPRRHPGRRAAVRRGAGRRQRHVSRPPGRRPTSAASARARSSTATAAPNTTFRPRASTPANFVAVLQAELRAIASRLVMPEFMLTVRRIERQLRLDDGGRGPAVRMFARLQAELVDDDLQVMRRVLAAAVAAGHACPAKRSTASTSWRRRRRWQCATR